MSSVYRSINCKVVMPIAASLSIGIALEDNGGFDFMCCTLIDTVMILGSFAMTADIIMLTCDFWQIISKVATTILIRPVISDTLFYRQLWAKDCTKVGFPLMILIFIKSMVLIPFDLAAVGNEHMIWRTK